MNPGRGRIAGLIAGAVVLVLAAGAGGAVAGHKVTSAQIQNNTIKSEDVHNYALRGKDVHAHTLAYGKLTHRAQTRLVRAMGWVTVAADGSILNHGGNLAPPHVTHPAGEVFCVRGPGWVNGAYTATALANGEYQIDVAVDPTNATGICAQGVGVIADSGSNDSAMGFVLVRLG